MLNILYEDEAVLVVWKPVGMESQSGHGFDADMVSEIRRYLSTGKPVDNHKLSTKSVEPYVGVIHRLDKPVSGVMVYALSKNAAAALSRQVQDRKLEKIYGAVVCGKPEKDVDKFVDYLEKSVDGNESYVVDHGGKCGKRAELSYEALESLEDGGNGILTLLRIRLETGRHHQIRVQFASRGLPLFGDRKYGTGAAAAAGPLALCAMSLSFVHPSTGKPMTFSVPPSGGAFSKFKFFQDA